MKGFVKRELLVVSPEETRKAEVFCHCQHHRAPNLQREDAPVIVQGVGKALSQIPFLSTVLKSKGHLKESSVSRAQVKRLTGGGEATGLTVFLCLAPSAPSLPGCSSDVDGKTESLFHVVTEVAEAAPKGHLRQLISVPL